MLRQQIQDQVKEAMRNRDQVRLDALRYMWSEIKNAEIDAKVELDDEAIVAVVSKEVKKRKDAIEQMKEVGRDVVEEEDKLKVLMEFMPEQMGREEIAGIVDELMGEGVNEFGKLMGQVIGRAKGKADGKVVQEVVKEKLEN